MQSSLSPGCRLDQNGRINLEKYLLSKSGLILLCYSWKTPNLDKMTFNKQQRQAMSETVCFKKWFGPSAGPENDTWVLQSWIEIMSKSAQSKNKTHLDVFLRNSNFASLAAFAIREIGPSKDDFKFFICPNLRQNGPWSCLQQKHKSGHFYEATFDYFPLAIQWRLIIPYEPTAILQ